MGNNRATTHGVGVRVKRDKTESAPGPCVHRSCSAAARVCCDRGDKGRRTWGGWVSHHRRDLNLPARGEGLLKDTQTREPRPQPAGVFLTPLPGEAPAGVGRGWAERLGRLKAPLQEAKKKLGSSTPRQWASTSNLADPESPRHNWPTAPSGPWISPPLMVTGKSFLKCMNSNV